MPSSPIAAVAAAWAQASIGFADPGGRDGRLGLVRPSPGLPGARLSVPQSPAVLSRSAEARLGGGWYTRAARGAGPSLPTRRSPQWARPG